MPTVQRNIRIQEKTFKEIEQIVREFGKEFSAVTDELLGEAVRMWRCSGIVFSEGTAGRRARIAGTGIEVWEVIAAYKSMNKDFSCLQKVYHWLIEQQLRFAVDYCRAYLKRLTVL